MVLPSSSLVSSDAARGRSSSRSRPRSALVGGAGRGPRIDPRHVALAALVLAESEALDVGSRAELRAHARGLLDSLALLGGPWLRRPPHADARSVREALEVRDTFAAHLRAGARDAAEHRWLDVVGLGGGGTESLPFDLRILAAVAASVHAGEHAASVEALEDLADAVEEHACWTEAVPMRGIRAHVRRASALLVRRTAEVGPPGAVLAMARWSRARGVELQPTAAHVRSPVVEVDLDVGGARLWEGFTDGGASAGVFLPSWSRWEVGERLELTVSVQRSTPRVALGVVRWIREGAQKLDPGVGVELVDTSAALEADLRRLARRRPPIRVF